MIIALIKPQFEAEREEVGRKGLIKDDEVHKKVVEKIRVGMQEFGFEMQGVIDSPIKGAASGNLEFLALFTRK
jgi:23S rRNA (cytidine1920-2'-O)/16S rRNA (cytidine1409-2'-O)-methyltransferase